MIDLLRMLRPVNLLLIAFMLLAIKYGFLEPNTVETALDPLHFSLLLFATLCIAGAGNLINDIEDKKIDAINKPNRPLVAGKVSSKAAFNAYLILTILGVGAGFYLSNYLGSPGLTIVFIGVAALLYFYSSQLSQMAVVGNLSVSLMVGICVLLPVLFDLFPAIQAHGINLLQQQATNVLLYFACYAVYVNMVRELVKDIIDVDGDHAVGRKTLPILLGRSRSRQLALWLMVIVLIATLYFAYQMESGLQPVALYLLFAIGGSMLFISLQLYHAKRTKDYSIISILLKALLLVGILTFILFPNQLMML